jgi:hypothetical protein
MVRAALLDARVRQKLFSDDHVLHTLVDDKRLSEELLARDEFLAMVMKRLLGNQENYERLAARQMQHLSYATPSYLISYPRSGSNFLQSVVQGSSGLRCRSVYAFPHVQPQYILSLKSHALSFGHLLDEISRLVPDAPPPQKLVVLFRDPRDVMVSFYEFLQVRKDVQIPQVDFLEGVSYFYATYKDRDMALARRSEYAPISIAESYRKHVRNWVVEPPNDLDCLTVRYEDLVLSPEIEFQRIFDFLELDCALAAATLADKVSLYSEGSRPRGEPHGWRTCEDQYPDLLARVRTMLNYEIGVLGYD